MDLIEFTSTFKKVGGWPITWFNSQHFHGIIEEHHLFLIKLKVLSQFSRMGVRETCSVGRDKIRGLGESQFTRCPDVGDESTAEILGILSPIYRASLLKIG